jgi:hypothetical protein
METIPQVLTWEHAYPGREAAERNAVWRALQYAPAQSGPKPYLRLVTFGDRRAVTDSVCRCGHGRTKACGRTMPTDSEPPECSSSATNVAAMTAAA